jgi:hypothetical protein
MNSSGGHGARSLVGLVAVSVIENPGAMAEALAAFFSHHPLG